MMLKKFVLKNIIKNLKMISKVYFYDIIYGIKILIINSINLI
jgi:hypothetical protein